MKATLSYIKQKFDEYNEMIFDGHLLPLSIEISNARRTAGQVLFIRNRSLFGEEHYSDFHLRISGRLDFTESEMHDVLIHEMIHYYILSGQMHDTSAHGRIFRKLMADINSKYGRHVAISRKTTKEEQNNDRHVKGHYICVTTLDDGRTGLTISARTRVFEMWRSIPRYFNIKAMTWWGSADPYFNRYPNSLKPKIYIVDKAELEEHLKGAVELECDGHIMKPKK
jgi:predicted SprT family Zn-dependent metalloprotease